MNTLSFPWPGPVSAALLSVLMIAAPMPAAWAHDGDDHDHDEAAETVVASGPRAASQTEDFELVAALNGSTLTIYLDDVDTNEPVKDAEVELESAGFNATATRQAPGVYTANAPALLRPGRYPMTVAVDTADGADLIDVTLDTTAAHGDGGQDNVRARQSDHGHSGVMRHPWPWAIGIAAVLIAAGLLMRARAKARSRAQAEPAARGASGEAS